MKKTLEEPQITSNFTYALTLRLLWDIWPCITHLPEAFYQNFRALGE